MKKIKFLILGAGPSGLTIANSLIFNGIDIKDICVLEKESTVGGLCRSRQVDGAPLDTGGGHFLDVKKKNVLDFIFRFMPKNEWTLHDRISKIRIRGTEIDHPLEANLWQLPMDVQVDFLESIAQAGCVRGDEMPLSFAEWTQWKLGERISEEYMLPYNRKIWSMDPDHLGTYWLYKLPDVSFRETLLSCLQGKPMGNLPAHGTFLYPNEFGYGEVWRRMGVNLGDSLVTNCTIKSIDIEALTVNDCWQADTIINTIPWTLWPAYSCLPPDVTDAIGKLKNAPIDVDYFADTIKSTAHWIYEPDETYGYHRLLLRSNFAHGARGYWTETNANRSVPTDGIRFHNEFAYPINTLEKPAAVELITTWAKSNNIISLGRWGRWEHMNSDIAVSEALDLANKLTLTNL
jgi:protoporphyrinogen oxidase